MAKTTKQQIRVLMADDHAIFREGLRKLLDGDDEITIVGEASNGNDCIKMLAKLKPDILLLDLRMPDKDGRAAKNRCSAIGRRRSFSWSRRATATKKSAKSSLSASRQSRITCTTFSISSVFPIASNLLCMPFTIV